MKNAKIINDNQKEYCANNNASGTLAKLYAIFPNKKKDELISSFVLSQTYTKLYDYSTELWKEGVDYILNLFLEENSSIN